MFNPHDHVVYQDSKILESAPHRRMMAFTAQYIFIEHRNHVYRNNIHSLNWIGNSGSLHGMAAGETRRGQQTTARKFTEETTFENQTAECI